MRLFIPLRTCVLFAAILTFAVGCAVADPLGLYSTGDGPNGLLTVGSTDPYWTISASTDPAYPSGGSAYVVNPATSNATTVPCCWLPATATSQWVNPSGNSQQGFGPYTYTYTTTFTLPTGPTAYTSITGWFSADDNASILLNGTTVLAGADGHYYTTTPFDITSGFVSGTNTLSFLVSNATGGPTGLQVQLSSTFVPEPTSIALVGIVLLGAGLFFRRRFSS